MAVTNNPVGSTIRLNLITGLNPQGGPIISQKSLSNVKSAATDQVLFDRQPATASPVALGGAMREERIPGQQRLASAARLPLRLTRSMSGRRGHGPETPACMAGAGALTRGNAKGERAGGGPDLVGWPVCW